MGGFLLYGFFCSLSKLDCFHTSQYILHFLDIPRVFLCNGTEPQKPEQRPRPAVMLLDSKRDVDDTEEKDLLSMAVCGDSPEKSEEIAKLKVLFAIKPSQRLARRQPC